MYMYLIYIIELRRKPLFSSLPTNKAFIFRQLDLIYYFTNIKNSVIKKVCNMRWSTNKL